MLNYSLGDIVMKLMINKTEFGKKVLLIVAKVSIRN